MPHASRRQLLADAIAQHGLDFYLVPMEDAFQSEYIPPHAARLPYLTGFDGSAGLGIFRAAAKADAPHALFVDGRYILQASAQFQGQADMAVINSGEMRPAEWLAAEAAGARIGFDPWLVTEQQREAWQRATESAGAVWVPVSENLVDGIWHDQPTPPAEAITRHTLEYAGRSYAEKREALLQTLRTHKADALLLAQPDSVNWLLNLRGQDVAFNPLLLAQLVLKADGSASLLMQPRSLSAEVADYLVAQGVAVRSIAEVYSGDLPAEIIGQSVLMDAATTAHGWFMLAEKCGARVQRVSDPAALPKAQKNSAELAGIRAAHAVDGLALSRFLHWFEMQVSSGRYPDELQIIARLEAFRAQEETYRGASFATIAGAGEHGAIVHYRADAASNRAPRAGELLLVDSGGQYPGGTTDVTRTLFVSSPAGGAPTRAMKDHFTRVLKGHIALASARFPAGTTGAQIDVLARHALWQAGLDYDHGTGHGVGAYLCVHEGPQRISKRGGDVALLPGMILSNEPGYYAAGEYGIRTESLLCVVEAGSMVNGKPMLAFDTLTLAPIDVRLITPALLTMEERNWLNNYHRRVYDAHASHLDGEARAWLMEATRAA